MAVKTHGGRRAGAGRKPKPRRTKQAARLRLNLTSGELAAVRRAARGEPLATWARRAVLAKVENGVGR